MNRNSDEKLQNKRRNNIIYSVIVICVLGIIVGYFNNKYIYNDKISNNIFIENIDVSNMEKDKAIELINNNKIPDSFYLVSGDNRYEIKKDDINLKYNIEESINKAYNHTRSGSYIQDVKRYISLKNNPLNIELKLLYDEKKLTDCIKNISNELKVEVVNASVYISDYGKISSTSSVVGKEVDEKLTKEKVIQNINNKKYEDVQVKINEYQPNIKIEDVKSINTLLAEFSTKFSPDVEGRNHNIKLSADKSSDVLLMPGEEYSYNELTGMRTKANGYKNAPVIVNGKLEDALGGGVCQVSSTLYNSVLSSGMQLTSITNHSLLSPYVPIGRDAMVNDGGTDFRFKNPYSHPVYIKNIVSNGKVISRIYGNSQDKSNIEIYVEAFKENGLDASNTYRIHKDKNGNKIRTEYIDKSIYKKPKK